MKRVLISFGIWLALCYIPYKILGYFDLKDNLITWLIIILLIIWMPLMWGFIVGPAIDRYKNELHEKYKKELEEHKKQLEK